MRTLRWIAPLAAAVLLASSPARSQDFTGTYAVSGNGTTVTLVLRQARDGQITGTLQGNTAFNIQARAQGGTFSGYASNQAGRIYLQGRLAGNQLQVAMAEVGADGQPQLGTARTVMMDRSAAAGPTPGGAQPSAAGKPGLGAKAGGGAEAGGARGADPFAGTFAGDGLTLTLQRAGSSYTGSAISEGTTYRVLAQRAGQMLTGTYEGPGGSLPFQAMVQGDVMQLAAGGATYTLQRQSGMGQGLGGAAGAAGAGGVTSGSSEDQQIAQLLVSSRWCTMTYSGGVGTTSGTTRYERLVFRADGTGSRATSSEVYSSGDAGIAAGQSAGGSPFQWRVEGGVLVSTTDGANWVRTPMRISRNSNGYPIITANGKDYAMCN